MKRIVAGFLLSPPIPVAIVIMLTLAWAGWQAQHVWPSDAADWRGLMIIMLIGLAIAYALALIFGLPIVLMFRRWRMDQPWPYALASALCALGVCSAFLSWGFGYDDDGARDVMTLLPVAFLFFAAGAMGGWAFWSIAVRNNPKFCKEGIARLSKSWA